MRFQFPDQKTQYVSLPQANKINTFIIEKDTIAAINLALASNKPLLLRGELSYPKRELGEAIAHLLNRAIFEEDIDPEQNLESLLWTYDQTARLAAANLLATMSKKTDEVHALLNMKYFIYPGPLWWAFDSAYAEAQSQATLTKGVGVSKNFPNGWRHHDGNVLLIEGIDQCARSIPLRLSRVLQRGSFSTPTQSQVVRQDNPLIIFTTDEERRLHSSFLHSCIVHTINLPSSNADFKLYLLKWGQYNFPNVSSEIKNIAAKMITKEREYYLNRAVETPSIREFIDLIIGVEKVASSHEEKLKYLQSINQIPLYSSQDSWIENTKIKNKIAPTKNTVTSTKQEVSIKSNQPAVFISYASSDNNSFVERLYNFLRTQGYNIKIDKNDIEYKELVSRYIEALGNGGAVIALVSDNYLRSNYCMWELLKVYENKNFHKRLFPVVFPNAKITDGVGRLKYTVYWQEKRKELYDAMDKVDTLSISQETVAEASRLRDFVDKVDLLASKVADMNFRPIEKLTDKSLTSLEHSLNKQLEQIGLLKNT